MSNFKKILFIAIIVLMTGVLGSAFITRLTYNPYNNIVQNFKESNEKVTLQRLLLKADKLFSENNYEQAIETYKQALKIDNKSLYSYCQIGICYMNINKYDTALYNLTEAAHLQPQNCKLYKLIGDCQLKLSKEDLAISSYKRAIELNSKKDAFAYVDLIRLLMKNKKYEDIKKYIKNFEDLASKNVSIANDSNSSIVYDIEAQIYSDSKNYESALEACNKSLKVYDKNVLTYNLKGYICIQIGDYNSAINSYNKAIYLKINDSSIYNNLAYCLIKQGKYNEAVKNYDKALKINPNDEIAKRNREIAIAALKK